MIAFILGRQVEVLTRKINFNLGKFYIKINESKLRKYTETEISFCLRLKTMFKAG